MTAGPSLVSRGVAVGTRAVLRPQLDSLPLEGISLHYLRHVIGTGNRLATPSSHATFEEPNPGSIRGEWVRARGAPRTSLSDGVILYLHGGGYVAGSAREARPVTVPLAELTGLPVFSCDYRLAPEHQFPAALNDGLDAFDWLIKIGVPANRIVVAGDSSGAHLAMGMALSALDAGTPVPAALVLFSPLLDPSAELAHLRDVRRPDPMFSPTFAARCAAAYVRDHDLADPRISSLRAGPRLLAGLPPVLTIVGSTECFQDDSQRLHSRLSDLEVPNERRVVAGQVHTFVTLNRWVPEARAALVRSADFIRASVGQTAPVSPNRPLEDPMAKWYPLEEVGDDFLASATTKTVQVIDVPVPVEQLWDALSADDAVKAWSPAVSRVSWSAKPYGVGTIREVTIGGAATVREQFYRWDENKRMTFFVAESSRPGIRRFAEDYVVESTATGSRLTWTVALEPKRLAGPGARIGSAALGLAVGKMTRTLGAQLRRTV